MTGVSVEQLKARLGVFVGLILAGVVTVSSWTVVTERLDTIDRAERRVSGYARALAEHSESAFAESDRLLRDLLRDIRREGGAARIDPRKLFDEMVAEAADASQVGVIFLADRHGVMFSNSGEYPPKPVNVADRDYFRYYVDTPVADLTLGKPVMSRLVGRWRFNLMRPLNAPGEPFDGLAAIAFEVDYFKKFFDADSLGPHGRVILVRNDGAPLVFTPYVDNAYQRNFRDSEHFRALPPGVPNGTYRVARGLSDNSARIVSWQRVARFPVVAMISLAEEDVLAPWRNRALTQGALTIGLCLVILLLTRIMFQHLDRLREAQATLVEQQERQHRLEEQLRHIQKIEAVGQLAGGVAHDFNNLLTPIIVSAELARRAISPGDPLNGRMEGILSAAHKAKDLTQKLLSVARRQMLSMAPIDLNRVVSDLREILRRTIREEIEIDMRLSPGTASILGDQGQIEQILLNLAVNAQDAIAGHGRIAIETGRVTIDDALAEGNPGMRTGPHVFLSFSDTGCGMDPDVVAHVFEPFFTTKAVGQGTGLGLATVYGIVKQHEGYVRVDSRPGEGTTFVIYFPACSAEEDRRPAAAAQNEPPKALPGNCEVLVVEDNEMVRALIVGMLGTFGYKVTETGSPREAIRIAGEPGRKIDLLISDMIMPEMNGRQVYDLIRATRPSLPALFISGYTQDASIPNAQLGRGVRFLKKPFTVGDFLENVRASLEGR